MCIGRGTKTVSPFWPCRLGLTLFLYKLRPSTITDSRKTFKTLPLFPRSLPFLIFTWSPLCIFIISIYQSLDKNYLETLTVHTYTISSAIVIIFSKPFVFNSLGSGPKILVAIGSFLLSIKTTALSSNLT